MTLLDEVLWEWDHKYNCWLLEVSGIVQNELDRLRQGRAQGIVFSEDEDPAVQCPHADNFIDERLHNLYSNSPAPLRL